MGIPSTTVCGTGVAGLDDIVGGGLPRNCLYLIEGSPGVGKTTLAMQFLLEGQRAGEQILYVSLSETRQELMAVAKSHGWDLEGITIIELSAIEPDPRTGGAGVDRDALAVRDHQVDLADWAEHD